MRERAIETHKKTEPAMQSLTQTRPFLAAPARPFVLRLLDRIAAADAAYRQKVALRGMSAERLADMGLTEVDIEGAFRR